MFDRDTFFFLKWLRFEPLLIKFRSKLTFAEATVITNSGIFSQQYKYGWKAIKPQLSKHLTLEY